MINKSILEEIAIDDFFKIDIRVGTILNASFNKKAKKPAYILDIDFGDVIGIKKSSAQITENYSLEILKGQQILAVMNFPPMRVAGVKSEVLVLAVVCDKKGTILIEPTKDVNNGEKLL
ncbi:tRNA-binding protein [Sulfurimonas sp. CS5]|uniref:tRNA-binding protein n=1 Tax=Sulfurimonas sp. CS5 TaxID=3391145 RepID=UPI0039E744E3